MDFKINDLVTHSKRSELGIGVVTKILQKKVEVHFKDWNKFNPSDLQKIDVSKVKTITFSEFQRQSMLNTVKDDEMIVGNNVRRYVGIGWTEGRQITLDDLKKYKRVI